jgi:catechol 2,3-dioxygenase-like lactoylglutathione lyase family enzyme
MNTTCSAATTDSQRAPVRFHLSLNVAALEASIEFFRVFFRREPAKQRPDYAKFELDNPPLVLSLEPSPTGPGGNLNHLGFRMADSAALVEIQRRLELAGIKTVREEGVECCYARQTKFWVTDPDGNMWEIYTLDEDIEHRGSGALPILADALPSDDQGKPAPAIWQHHLGALFPQRLPILDATVDRVVLEGTFNELFPAEEERRRLAEINRILKPGGVVHLHMLTANQPLSNEPWRLPGPAARVSCVPTGDGILQQLADAGFLEPRFTFHAASPCFRAAGAELRETRIEGTKV